MSAFTKAKKKKKDIFEIDLQHIENSTSFL